jgi:hypothetical protein
MKIFFSIALLLALTLGYGCASQIDSANKGTEKGGKAVGGVMGIPNSAAEGVADGIKGSDGPNPYNR